MGVIRLAGLFVLVVVVAAWVLFASSILDALGNGGRAAVISTVEPASTEPAPPTPATSPGASGSATAVPVATEAPASAPSAEATGMPAGVQRYTIQRGDNLSRIARRFGVTVKALQEANGITDPSSIRLGQELVIPAP